MKLSSLEISLGIVLETLSWCPGGAGGSELSKKNFPDTTAIPVHMNDV